jgi:hypothetical protein
MMLKGDNYACAEADVKNVIDEMCTVLSADVMMLRTHNSVKQILPVVTMVPVTS